MFNGKLKKNAVNELKKQVGIYEERFMNLIKGSERLHELRTECIEHIVKVETYVNTLANRPVDFDRKLEEVDVNRKSFSDQIKKIDMEFKKVEVKAGLQAGAGAAAGVGVAALGPSAAMAVATTFGTASTGTAIASLSGAAATNAALAWIGGGALAAGGSGMAGGTAFLALAGPLGMAIGGGAMFTAGILASKKNKKLAEKAEEETIRVREEISGIIKIEAMMKPLTKLTNEFLIKNDVLFKGMEENFPKDYNEFNFEQKNMIGALVNNTHAMSKLIIQKVGEK